MSQQMFILENAIGAAAREYLAHKWDVHAVPQGGDGKAPAAWSLSARVGARDRLGGEASARQSAGGTHPHQF